MRAGSAEDEIHLKLPATSANLGPGFDTAAVALDFHLHVTAAPASEFAINATGRDARRCGRLDGNLVLDLYRKILIEQGRTVLPLALHMSNEIPLGMGCGSSAAGRLAAIALADHYGQLGWSSEQIVAEASRLEGHPDNVAACWFGGFVASGFDGPLLQVARVVPPSDWRAIVVLPREPLATSKARAVLPATYARADVVANLQAVSMLGLAFAQGRGDLLRAAMQDRVHQPYRQAICPQLPRLLPLAREEGILGVALSGAGPAVLVVTESEQTLGPASEAIRGALAAMSEPELIHCRFETQGAASVSSR